MSKWKVYALYFADADDPFDRCYCGKWRFQGIAFARDEDEAIRHVQRRRIGEHFTDSESAVSYELENFNKMKRREHAGVLWKAEREGG